MPEFINSFRPYLPVVVGKLQLTSISFALIITQGIGLQIVTFFTN